MRRGTTLIEMMVALALLGLLTGIAAAAVASLRRPEPEEWKQRVVRAREAAIRSGHSVVLRTDSGYRALLLPDGRALGAGLDPLTGEVLGAAR